MRNPAMDPLVGHLVAYGQRAIPSVLSAVSINDWAHRFMAHTVWHEPKCSIGTRDRDRYTTSCSELKTPALPAHSGDSIDHPLHYTNQR